ncbi:hypothetical protein HD806DRAFT_541308 [Xylariaceae sp. AK1471]|nr:hypothetical protein HD806DRAFT_541308 [Xylariaceae sp. AK1471]
MAPKTEKSGDLTEKEKIILGLAWKCFLGAEPKMDWDKLAALGNYTNVGSAKNILHSARKKLNGMADGEASGAGNGDGTGGDEAAGAAAVATPTKKKQAAKAKGKRKSDDDDDDNPETPTPKRAKKAAATPSAKKAATLVEKNGDDDVEYEVMEKGEMI